MYVSRKSGGCCNSSKGRRGYGLSRRANRDAEVVNFSIHDVVDPAVDENILESFWYIIWYISASCDSGRVAGACLQ